MMGISWIELMVIVLVALIVFGPKNLPEALMTLARSLRAARRVAREFQSQVDQFLRESEIEALRRDVEDAVRKDNVPKRTPDPPSEIAPPPSPAPKLEPASRETAGSKDVAPKDSEP